MGLLGIILGILMLGALIVIHEFGHMVTARWAGVRVKTFCIGIGQPIRGLRWTSKRTGTVYGIAPFPIGGMVDLKGMVPPKQDTEAPAAPEKGTVAAMAAITGEVADETEPYSTDPNDDNFYTKPYWKKAIVLVSGAGMNLLAGWLILVVLAATFIQLPDKGSVLGRVVPGSSAATAGLVAGDRFVGWEDKQGQRQEISEFAEITQAKDAGGTVFFVERAGQERKVVLDPRADRAGNRVLGVMANTRRPTPVQAVRASFVMYGETFSMMGKSYGMLFGGKLGVPLNQAVSGPVGIVKVASGYIDAPKTTVSKAERSVMTEQEVKDTGIRNFFFVWAFIAVNLGLVNLLPIPPLDGGKLVEEAFAPFIRRKPLLQQGIRYATMTMFLALMALMLLVTANDVFKLFVGAQ